MNDEGSKAQAASPVRVSCDPDFYVFALLVPAGSKASGASYVAPELCISPVGEHALPAAILAGASSLHQQNQSAALPEAYVLLNIRAT